MARDRDSIRGQKTVKPKYSVRNAKTHKDFVKAIEHQGGGVRERSNHTQVGGRDGKWITVPRHRGDLATGTRHSVKGGCLDQGFGIITFAILVLALADRLV